MLREYDLVHFWHMRNFSSCFFESVTVMLRNLYSSYQDWQPRLHPGSDAFDCVHSCPADTAVKMRNTSSVRALCNTYQVNSCFDVSYTYQPYPEKIPTIRTSAIVGHKDITKDHIPWKTCLLHSLDYVQPFCPPAVHRHGNQVSKVISLSTYTDISQTSMHCWACRTLLTNSTICFCSNQKAGRIAKHQVSFICLLTALAWSTNQESSLEKLLLDGKLAVSFPKDSSLILTLQSAQLLWASHVVTPRYIIHQILTILWDRAWNLFISFYWNTHTQPILSPSLDEKRNESLLLLKRETIVIDQQYVIVMGQQSSQKRIRCG